MILHWLDPLSNWNPQLWRELKVRLKPGNMLPTLCTSFGIQLLILLAMGILALDNWQSPEWWSGVFVILNGVFPFFLLLAGTYTLVRDLFREQQQGTLSLIRHSPQSGNQVLLGKLLGVPSLVYLAGILAVPLHLIAASQAGVSLLLVLGFYGFLAALCWFGYSIACLYVFRGGFPAWVVSSFVILLVLPLFYPQVYPLLHKGESLPAYYFQWFSLPLGQALERSLSFATIVLLVCTYWLWQSLQRCYHQPGATLLSKPQSYWVTACFEVFLLGFVIPTYPPPVFGEAGFSIDEFLSLLFIGHLVGFLMLIVALSPQRQALMDWVRYRRPLLSQNPPQPSRHSNLRQELLWGEKSPALLAIALNLGIAATLWCPWVLWGLNDRDKTNVLLGLLFSGGLILISATLAQCILLWKRNQHQAWVGATISSLVFLSAIGLGGLATLTDRIPGGELWLLTAFPFQALGSASHLSVFLALLTQIGILGCLSWQLTQQFRQLGMSASQALLSQQPLSLPN
jgi:hypothetical protein